MKKLLLLLLLTLTAWAAPGWHDFAPAGEPFHCQFPDGPLKESRSKDSRYWILIQKGKSVLQVGYAIGAVTPATTEECIQAMLKIMDIQDVKRTTRKQGKLTVIDVVGFMGKNGAHSPFHMLAYPQTNRIYFMNTIIFQTAQKPIADKFLSGFSFK